jgi:hypothetical protein
MNEKLIHYLTLISKLSDILKYINNNFKDDEKDSYDLSSYIQECKAICINIVKSEPLIELFLYELHDPSLTTRQQEIKQQQNKVETIIPEQDIEDIELKEQVDTLAILLTGTLQDKQDEPMSSETFDTLGSGLSRLLKITDGCIPQLKNEIYNKSSNINFEIKRK